MGDGRSRAASGRRGSEGGQVRAGRERDAEELQTEERTPSLPSVPGDSQRLQQVLHNLLDNAIKYSPHDSQITISGEIKNEHIQVSIADEGQGIPQAELGKIFNAFYRISDSDAQNVRGAGLGLTICKAIVEAHGGSIWAENAQGKGNIFYFTLPLEEVV